MSSEHAPIVVDPSLADMLVRCPIPGYENELPERLGDFVQTERGKRVGAAALENITVLTESGIDIEKAAVIAFGGAIVTDEAGQIVRSPQPEEASIQLQHADSKKK
jgi:hypothetical protein